MPTGYAAESIDRLNKNQAGDNESDAESSQTERSAAPVAARIVERDESGENAVADSAQRQAHPMRRHPPKHQTEWQMFTVHHRNRRLCEMPLTRLDCTDHYGEETQCAQPPDVIENHAERGADRHRAVGADAVVGDDFCGALVPGAG